VSLARNRRIEARRHQASEAKETLTMKKRVLRVVFVGVVTLVPLVCFPAGRTGPFRVRVVDERTGAGVPTARVTVENGAVGTTAFDGSVLFWLDTALMKRTVHFTIEQRGVTTTVELPVTSGGVVAVPVPAP
jgi:hypothetical protein